MIAPFCFSVGHAELLCLTEFRAHFDCVGEKKHSHMKRVGLNGTHALCKPTLDISHLQLSKANY